MAHRQISNTAKDYFFYLMIKQDNAIDDVNNSLTEIRKALTEVETNINIEGLNSCQYLCLYLEDIDIRIKSFENPIGPGFGGIIIKSRIRILHELYNSVFTLLVKVNKLNGTSIYPKSKQVIVKKLTVNEVALLHYYLGQCGGKKISKQNQETIAKEYGFKSGDNLKNIYSTYKREDTRLNFKGENKTSADMHMKRFYSILPILEITNIEAFKLAGIEYEILKKKYSRFH
jgi:hypothetical protein